MYKKHNYHPIHNVLAGTSFLVMLPILISAIFLFTNELNLNGVGFLFIDNLAKPDDLYPPVNVLPITIFMVTTFEAKIRYKDSVSNQLKFLFIAVILLVLIYKLPSSLILYWLGNSAYSLGSAIYSLNSK